MLTIVQSDQHAIIDAYTETVLSLHTTAIEAHQQRPKVAPFMPHPDFDVIPVRVTVERLPMPAPVQQLALPMIITGERHAHASRR